MLLEVFQGLHGGHFDFYKLVGNFVCTCRQGVHWKKIKKSKKLNHESNSFFITVGLMSGNGHKCPLSGCNRCRQLVGWVDFCVLYMLLYYLLYNTVRFVKN